MISYSEQKNMMPARSNKADIHIFNKRLYSTRGSVVLTSAAREILTQNARDLDKDVSTTLTRSQLCSMRCVVDGLKHIHRDENYIKDILSHVVTLETYAANEKVDETKNKLQLCCYYIVTGSVKATYDTTCSTQTRNIHQPGIIYSHGVGEYLGMVSPEGIQDDFSPPTSLWILEPTELLRIDRSRFHHMVCTYKSKLESEKKSFISDPRCILSKAPADVVDTVLPYISKMDALANKTIILQDVLSEFMYFVVSGRCELTRKVTLPRTGQVTTFHMDSREPYSFFAEECILSSSPSSKSVCTATTTLPSVFFTLSRVALDVVPKEQLFNILQDHAQKYPPDEELILRGLSVSAWNRYKYSEILHVYHQIKPFLKQSGEEKRLRDHQDLGATQHQKHSRSSANLESMRKNFGKGEKSVQKSSSGFCFRSDQSLKLSRNESCSGRTSERRVKKRSPEDEKLGVTKRQTPTPSASVSAITRSSSSKTTSTDTHTRSRSCRCHCSRNSATRDIIAKPGLSQPLEYDKQSSALSTESTTVGKDLCNNGTKDAAIYRKSNTRLSSETHDCDKVRLHKQCCHGDDDYDESFSNKMFLTTLEFESAEFLSMNVEDTEEKAKATENTATNLLQELPGTEAEASRCDPYLIEKQGTKSSMGTSNDNCASKDNYASKDNSIYIGRRMEALARLKKLKCVTKDSERQKNYHCEDENFNERVSQLDNTSNIMIPRAMSAPSGRPSAGTLTSAVLRGSSKKT